MSFYLTKTLNQFPQAMQQLINSACDRVQHFQKALSLYDKFFNEDATFQANFLSLLDALTNSEKAQVTKQSVFFIAVGKSAGIARVAASMFVSVGLPIQFLHPTEAFHGDFGVVRHNDTIVFISNSGNSSELLQLIPSLKERSVKIFTITAKPNSPLGIKSDFILQLPPVEEKCPLYQSPITSALTSLALCQLLVAASVEKRNFSLEAYAKNHPGGSIGKRIFLKVDDIMSKGENLPTIEPHHTFPKLISLFTSHAKACLLVIGPDKRLIGLIAERDIRRAMEKFNQSVFEKTVEDIMNHSPISIHSGALAVDALKIMTQYKPYLNVLPVRDNDGKAIGVIQIQDILMLGLSP